jgi:thymidylate synthase (FAD)
VGNMNYEFTTCLFLNSLLQSEVTYLNLLESGYSPQQARGVLPNSLKTEIVCTANFREWRHVFTLRCSKAAHPQMRELMIPLLEEVKTLVPVIFDDIEY